MKYFKEPLHIVFFMAALISIVYLVYQFKSVGKSVLRGPPNAHGAIVTAVTHVEVPNKLKGLLALAAKRARNGQIIIAIVDSGYIEMALNLWETSFVKFGITNYLFICMDEKAQTLLPPGANDCYIATKDRDGATASYYGTPAFNRKVMVKTKISLDLLRMGYSVMVVDLDIVFLENPIPYLQCDDCDLVIQDNFKAILNSGFYLIKPTNNSIELQKRSVGMAQKHKDDQNIMNALVRKLKKSHNFSVKLLDVNKFPSGIVYFAKRHFASEADCGGCIIIHNNFVVGLRKKIYRFKEMLLWVVDTNGYYTSTTNKYLMYDNPTISKEKQKEALELALEIGKLLNRIVILPQFNCQKRKKCHLLSAFGKYSQTVKEITYRESVFLKHPKVPWAVKHSISPDLNAANFITNRSMPVSQKASKILKGIQSNKTLMGYKVLKFNILDL